MVTKPIVKWAGGKRQLLPELLARVPVEFGAYHEFFLGGGALFFELYGQELIDTAYLADINPDLMNLYNIVKKRPYELIEELKAEKYENDEKTFYSIRSQEVSDGVQRAARFLYLNRTAYNGLYRVNSKGKFNVPFGRYKNPRILDEVGLLAASEALSCAKLMCTDFSDILIYAKEGDFAYFDPPYYPLNGTSNFTSYTSAGFGFEEQQKLKKTVDSLVKKNVDVLISNSATDFIKNLYSNYKCEIVVANRMINCIAERRGTVKEIVITGGKNEI